MVFSSPVFLFLFLPVVLLLVLSAGTLKARNTILTIASLFFYAWGETLYVVVMLGSILLNYLMGLWLGAASTSSGRKIAITVAVVSNLGLLAWFKYANFIVDNLAILLDGFDISMTTIDPVQLPIGISFFTFQSLSYVIDVYRREVPEQRKLGNLALYISLFPQLIAGPIVRYQDVMDQIDDRRIDLEGFAIGARRFIIGLGKKLLIADHAARVADTIYAIPEGAMPVSVAWLGALAYSIQIYFDFSGYSDMAIGLGRMFGFHFLENFNFPFIARSIREFWQRWHISLTTWFRDYVYIPLGGSRGTTLMTYRNLLAIFFFTGLWHGASWNFVIWGLFHGMFLVIERLGWQKILDKLPAPFGIVYMMIVLNVAWALFHTNDLESAWNYMRSMFGTNPHGIGINYLSFYLSNDFVVVMILGALASTPLLRTVLARMKVGLAERSVRVRAFSRSMYAISDVSVHALILLLCAMHMASNTYAPFIYFRF
ncbi:MAG: MBOAT family protein [Flavobacteriales bacterium]|jgi:alginate O-acetyltransferase complex protein AlgI|nr:MBOAT family protein [Flavobacteriales bacterium]MBK6550952.1 MBOAT family protein [Flavobacteriales bacterium]MBK6882509.1 MBOAT family protein [Flavobacteriales bacterium]MBK7101276.1 MBOAT family protein [Flavobacteriales bacterium]MBK7111983.1 MBOAT family protein [Flavobacteriales bacterium]